MINGAELAISAFFNHPTEKILKKSISVAEFTGFMNSTFPRGLACPLCGEQEWEVREENGVIDVLQTLDPASTEEIEELFENKEPDKQCSALANTQPKIASENIAIRCTHCGYLAHFDKLFVEAKIYG